MRIREESALSPYAAGVGIGLLNTLAFATVGRGIGITSAFEDAAALAERRIAPDLTRINSYLQQREKMPKLGWEALLVLGVLAGSALSANAAGERRRGSSAALQPRVGSASAARLAAAFTGGALMMFGARMAKGCTSGHAITGNSQFAASSLLFTPIMFASAIAAARALYGEGSKR